LGLGPGVGMGVGVGLRPGEGEGTGVDGLGGDDGTHFLSVSRFLASTSVIKAACLSVAKANASADTSKPANSSSTQLVQTCAQTSNVGHGAWRQLPRMLLS
jgi:hypothetical protein